MTQLHMTHQLYVIKEIVIAAKTLHYESSITCLDQIKIKKDTFKTTTLLGNNFKDRFVLSVVIVIS